MTDYKMCTRCVMDTTDPGIGFDEAGICNRCKDAELLLKQIPYSLSRNEKEHSLNELVAKIKKDGIGKRYDCVIGVSGGVDSTYVAYKVKQLGLRPLAVHFDNGWNSELSVKNIENTLNKLGIDLFTYVVDWEEFKDLQLAFLKASTPDSEIPTDHALVSLLYKKCLDIRSSYILAGSNLATESIMPKEWSYGHNDWKYIKGIHRTFGNMKLKTYPHRSFLKHNYYKFIKKIQWIGLLNYLEYNKKEAKLELEKEICWRPYKYKHFESVYTRFYQGYILPHKFGFDKRKPHLSSEIISGQITRDDALEELSKEIYAKEELNEDLNYVLNKFNLTKEQFDSIMNLPVKTFWDYQSSQNSRWWKTMKNIYRFFK